MSSNRTLRLLGITVVLFYLIWSHVYHLYHTTNNFVSDSSDLGRITVAEGLRPTANRKRSTETDSETVIPRHLSPTLRPTPSSLSDEGQTQKETRHRQTRSSSVTKISRRKGREGLVRNNTEGSLWTVRDRSLRLTVGDPGEFQGLRGRTGRKVSRFKSEVPEKEV